MSSFVLALDFGHGGGRALFLDVDNGKSFSSYQKWSYFSPEGDDFCKEFDPSTFFKILCDLVRVTIDKNKIKPEDVVGISAASMRHSYVFLDKNNKEIYGGPNFDTRGLFYQDVFEEEVDLDLYNLTGQWPPLMFMPARLLWFKNEKPDLFNRIKYAVSTCDWLIYKLSGVFASEPSLACNTMLFDIYKKTWVYDILERLDMNDINLPELRCSGEKIGELRRETSKLMGLKENTPIVLGGSDTQLGLLSSNVVNDYDVGIVAGTSNPVMMVLSKPVIDDKRRIWTGCHVLKDKWVLESNAQMSGLIYEWMKNNFQRLLKKDDDEVYSFMESLAREIPPGSDDVLSFLGSEIFNADNLSVIRPGMFTFQQPVHPMNNNPASFGHFVRACLENICFAIKGNIEQIEEVSNKGSDFLHVTGGMCKNNLWTEILANVTGKKIVSTNIAEGTSLGCGLCASVGVGLFKDFYEAGKKLVEFKKEIKPEAEKVKIYRSSYNNWKKWYDKLADI